MIKKLFILLAILFATVLSAGIGDFKLINAAQKAYVAKDYNKTSKLYKELNRDAASVHYDTAEAYYKRAKYKEALKEYKRAKGKGVDEHNRLHNIGNVYFKQKKFDDAIKAYEASLKIRKDKDTKYNLDLAKKQKKKKQK